MQPNPKVVKIGPKAREDAIRGIELVYQAVSATLGPRSANVAIARPYGRPAVVHDGVTVAKEVLPLSNPFEDVGAQLAVEAADKTNGVGDGTTTATVLMREIAKRSHAAIVSGAKPMALRAGIEDATRAVAEALTNAAVPVEGKDHKKNVESVRRIATISAQNEEIGGLVADAYDQLGRDGILSVEESRGTDTFLEIKTGMEIGRGYRSPYFITDSILEEAQLEDARVLVTDQAIRSVEQFGPVLQNIVESKTEPVRRLMIIAPEFGDEVLAFLIVNMAKSQGQLRFLAVQAPDFGDRRVEILKDIATVTGATFISEAAGLGLTPDTITPAMLGSAKRITATKDYTLIVGGGGSQEDIDSRAELIKTQADNSDTSAYDRERLMERYAKFKSGVAVLTIGAKSEPELKERKERAIDAISAAKAALDGGILPGGGTALLEAALAPERLLVSHSADRDYMTGVGIVIEACQKPFRKLLSNAGYDPGTYIEKVGSGKGFDVVSGEVVDMVKAGIIDPLLVVRSALENASSSAVMVATTNVIIIEQTRKESHATKR